MPDSNVSAGFLVGQEAIQLFEVHRLLVLKARFDLRSRDCATANLAAATPPGPLRSAYRLDMSESTPF